MNPRYFDAPAQQPAMVDLEADFTEEVPSPRRSTMTRNWYATTFCTSLPGRGKGHAHHPTETLRKWTPYVRDTWLKPLWAEALITNGIGEPRALASFLSPTEFQALKERVDVDFALTNAPFRSPADDVSLDVFLKNTPKSSSESTRSIRSLTFYAKAPAQYRSPLDGLVANREVTPISRPMKTGAARSDGRSAVSSFPELKGQRGAWVIEFIGGGKSSRALVRKGQWSLIQRVGRQGRW